MAPRHVTERATASLKPRPDNARTHSQQQINQIAESIRTFGFTNPVLIDRDGTVIAGHGRLAAAKKLALETVPTLCLEDLSEAELRAYALADNKLAENADWDTEILAGELAHLIDLDLGFEVTTTGFEMAEIDLILGASDGGDTEASPDDAVPAPEDGPAVTRPGDLWQIGPHRLLCADATEASSYECLLEGAGARMVFTDPPYNVPITGHVSGLGRAAHREFAMASGELSAEDFTAFLKTVFDHLAAASVDGALHYICMDWRHLSEVLAAGGAAFTELKNLCVWAKTNGGMGSLYRSRHELVFVFKRGRAPHVNNVDLGRHGRYRTNVWSYPGGNSFGRGRDEALAMHPTVKPVALVADAILDASTRKDIVLDAFTGSGTTLLAAHRTGRRGYGLEIDPTYCDVTLRRLARHCGLDAVHVDTGQTFAEITVERAAERDDRAVSGGGDDTQGPRDRGTEGAT